MRYKKPLDTLLKEAAETGAGTLKRTLGSFNLVTMGLRDAFDIKSQTTRI